MSNTARRIERTKDFEEWRFANEKYPFTDTVLIYFGPKINEIYLITSQPNVSDNEDYLSRIVNLVHDLDKDFNMNVEYVKIDKNVDDLKATDIIYEITEKIKKSKKR